MMRYPQAISTPLFSRKAVRLAGFGLLSACLSVAGGCTALTETNPEKPWSQDRYRELRQQDKERAYGEDHGPSDVGDVLSYAPRQMWSVVEWSWNHSTGHTPQRYKNDLPHRNADVRRKAIYVLSDRRPGRREPYTDYYATMGRDDRDPTVRAAAIRSLNRARSQKHTELYIAALSDKSEWVRLEAAKALANIPDSKAIAQLLKLLADEQQSRDIRIASADALRAYPQSEVAQALIRVLAGRDFGLAWQARRSLNLMTSRDFGYDQTAWLNYLTTNNQPFVGK